MADALKMVASPSADNFEYRHKGPSIFGDGVADAGWHGGFLVPVQDAVPDQLVEVANQHAFRDAGDAATQLTGAHGPF